MTREELKLLTGEYAVRVNDAVQELIEAGRYDIIEYQSPGDPMEIEQAPAGLIRTWRWVTVGGVQELRRMDLRSEEYPEIYKLKETIEQVRSSVQDSSG